MPCLQCKESLLRFTPRVRDEKSSKEERDRVRSLCLSTDAVIVCARMTAARRWHRAGRCMSGKRRESPRRYGMSRMLQVGSLSWLTVTLGTT